MPRKKSKASPEGNGPVPQDAYVMLGGITLVELRRVTSEALDKAFDKHFGQKARKSGGEQLISVQQASSRMLGSHVLPWRQT